MRKVLAELRVANETEKRFGLNCFRENVKMWKILGEFTLTFALSF